MTTQERFFDLANLIARLMISSDQVVQEIDRLSSVHSDPYYQRKLRSALGWAKLYGTERGAVQYGRTELQALLIADLTKARVRDEELLRANVHPSPRKSPSPPVTSASPPKADLN
jgi:hypothetical protein